MGVLNFLMILLVVFAIFICLYYPLYTLHKKNMYKKVYNISKSEKKSFEDYFDSGFGKFGKAVLGAFHLVGDVIK